MRRTIPLIIALLLFLLPFLWFGPGEMDLGGDSSRLYFYDPIAYLRNYSLYGISPSGFGAENIGYFTIPLVVVFALFRTLGMSATTLIEFFHGFSLALSFWAFYLVAKELLRPINKYRFAWNSQVASIVGGLYYTLSPISIFGWDKVLMTHNQVFLNPLMFYLLLRYIRTDRFLYFLWILLLSFVFSANFSVVAAPPLAAFYPLSILFLLAYRYYVLKKPLRWKHIGSALLLFLLLHAFHLVPQIVSMFSQGSVLYTTIFSTAGKIDRGLAYFSGIAPSIKVSLNILLLPQMQELNKLLSVFVVVPFIILFGFIRKAHQERDMQRTYLLTGFVFLVAFFFASANITNIGLALYKALFVLPGFAIFRNFYGQWISLFLFFFSLLLAQAIAMISKSEKVMLKILFVAILVLGINGWPLLNGSLVNIKLWKSKDVNIAITMDPQYEQALQYVRSLPLGGKVLTLPLTDPGYQIIPGTNAGAYLGPSTIAYVAGKKDFAGIAEFGPYSEQFLASVKQKDLAKMNKVFQLLGIRYVFYNADARAYDAFPSFPYDFVRLFFPKTQKDYKQFVESFGLPLLKQFGDKYFVYEIPHTLPVVQTASRVRLWNTALDNNIQLSLYEEGQPVIDAGSQMNLDASSPWVSEIIATGRENFIDQYFSTRRASKFPSPHVTRMPSWPLYQLVRWREEQDLQLSFNDSDLYIDKLLFYAEKRINELERWGNEIPSSNEGINLLTFAKEWEDPHILDFHNRDRNNSWNALLASYYQTLQKLTSFINQSNKSVYTPYANKISILRTLRTHRQRLMGIISNTGNMPIETKLYFRKGIDSVFQELVTQLNVKVPDIEEISYAVDETPSYGEYEIYVNRSQRQKEEIKSLVLTYEQEEKRYQRDIDDEWVSFGLVAVSPGASQMLTLKVKDVPNVAPDSWDLAESVDFSDGVQGLNSGSPTGKPLVGLIGPVDEFMPSSIYVMEFDYKTYHTPYNFYVHEIAQTGDERILLDEPLESKEWVTFRSLFQTGQDANRGLLQLVKGTEEYEVEQNSSEIRRIEIKNVSLRRIPHPSIFLRHIKSQNLESKAHPELAIEYINPTRYKVTVTDAQEPYVLLLNQAFDRHWKIYPITSKSRGVLGTWRTQPVAEDRHFQANGYANAWNIIPSDFGELSSYSFILETTTQRYFYVGAGISFMTLISLVFYFIRSSIRYDKKYRIKK